MNVAIGLRGYVGNEPFLGRKRKSMNMIKKVLVAFVAVLAISITAQANTITLTEVIGNLYQQTVQSPCIFSNPSCQNGSFPTFNLPTGGNETGYNAFSPIYTGSTLLAIMAGGPLRLGMDINQASGQ